MPRTHATSGARIGCRQAMPVLAAILLATAFSPAYSAPPSNTLGFTVKVTLSEKAARTLSATKENIELSVDYSAAPKPDAKKHAREIEALDEIGDIELGTEKLELPSEGGIARVTGRNVISERLNWILGPVKITVNAGATFKTHKDQILNCDFFDGDVEKSAQTELTLHCALHEENYSITSVKPWS